MPVRFGVGKLQKLKETREEQVTEKKSVEEFDAEIADVGEEGFSVRVHRKVFTAEAVEGSEGRTLAFDEEDEVEEFSADFVERHYLELLPSPWELLQELLEVEAVPLECVRVTPPAIHRTVRKKLSADKLAEPVIEPPEIESVSSSFRVHRRERPYEEFQIERNMVIYDLGMSEEELEVRAEVYVPEEDWAWEDPVEPADYPDQVQVTGYQEVGKEDRQRNAVEVVQDLFEYTSLEGTVQEVEDVGVDKEFDGELPDEIYDLDIEGLDMDRTEYFIDGELAENAINLYDLGPGNSLTFVQSGIFSGDSGKEYCGEGASLRLEDLSREDIEDTEGPYRVSEIPSFTGMETTYTPAAA